jgi:hypothetical protein
LLGVLEFDQHRALGHSLAVGEEHAVDKLGRRRGQGYGLTSLSHADDVDGIDEGLWGGADNGDRGRSAHAATAAMTLAALAGGGPVLWRSHGRTRRAARAFFFPEGELPAASEHHQAQNDNGADEEEMASNQASGTPWTPNGDKVAVESNAVLWGAHRRRRVTERWLCMSVLK